MCLIIAKPAGYVLPSHKKLKKAWQCNSDGFGLAFRSPDEAVVHITKGAMLQNEMFDLISSVPCPESKDMILHFRFATEGAITPENCHPFPISKHSKELEALVIDTKIAIAHNGIIPSTVNFGDVDEDEKAYEEWLATHSGTRKTAITNLGSFQSDTQKFIKSYLAGMGNALLNWKVLKLVEAYTLNKFAILAPHRLITVGDFVEEKGLFYSNGYWKYPLTYTTYNPADPRWSHLLPANKSYTAKAPDDTGRVPVYGQYNCDSCGAASWTTYIIKEDSKGSKWNMRVCRICQSYWPISDKEFEEIHSAKTEPIIETP